MISLPAHLHSKARSPQAFTLIELILVSAVLLTLSAMTIRSMFAYLEQRKLRTAAVEVSGYLQVARNMARAENGSCTLTLSAQGDELSPSKLTDNVCKDGSVPPAVRLRSLSGSGNLQAKWESGATSITFNPEGTITTGDTLLLSSANVPQGVWCVDVQAPLATVRLGWRSTGQSVCNFANEQ